MLRKKNFCVCACVRMYVCMFVCMWCGVVCVQWNYTIQNLLDNLARDKDNLENQKLDAVSLGNEVNTRAQLEGRPPFEFPIPPQQLNNQWDSLDAAFSIYQAGRLQKQK